jgi:MFS family permease
VDESKEDGPCSSDQWLHTLLVWIPIAECMASANHWNRNLAAVMFAPGAQKLAKEFGITKSIIASLTVSIYLLGFVIGPLFVSPLSEVYGRLPVYHIGNVIYLAFTIGCALSKNTAQFLVFRFISGCAASIPNTIGGGTVADIYPANERGKALALFALGPLLGPVGIFFLLKCNRLYFNIG